MNMPHEIIVAALEKGNPSMTFRERRLLQERDYDGLRAAVESYIRRTKSFMWSVPLIGLMQTVTQGWILPARGGWDASAALRNVAVLGGVLVVATAVIVSFGVSRLAKLERARTLLDLYLEGTTRYEVVGGEPERA